MTTEEFLFGTNDDKSFRLFVEAGIVDGRQTTVIVRHVSSVYILIQ